MSPSEVPAGASVTVSSEPAACGLRLDAGATYRLSLTIDDRSWALGEVEPTTDGQFSQKITVPDVVPAGRAWIDVAGSPYDECRDTGSCVGYQVELQVS